MGGRTEGAFVLILLIAAVVTCQAATCDLDQRPSIVYVNLDDVGYGDVNWHDSYMDTDNIRKIGEDGRFLGHCYTLQSCSPSRSAFMTSKYPLRYGLQKNSEFTDGMDWLSEDFKLLPQELKDLNYTTHMIGKWHLGFCSWNVLPLNRGFDTFYGKPQGNGDYFTHGSIDNHVKDYYNLFDQTQNVTDAPGKYSTNLFFERAEKIIREHSGPRPLFLYVAPQTAHTPYQVPEKYYAEGTKCGQIPYHSRKIFCAMIAVADEGVKNITRALKDKGIYDSTVIVVTSDNGASVSGGRRYGSNWPLRGGKVTLWEGGTRVFAVFKAPGLVNKGNTWDHLFHVVDWKPTLVEAACGEEPTKSDEDGMAMYNALVNDLPGQRTSFLYNVRSRGGHAAARGMTYKLMRDFIPKSTGWYPPETVSPDIIDVPEEDLPSGWHLYNMIDDPYEHHNLLENNASYWDIPEVQQLKAKIKAGDRDFVGTQSRGKSPISLALRSQVHHMQPGWCEVGGLPSACVPNPCQNGGTCILEERGHYCLCPLRASGYNCETLAPCEESQMLPGNRISNAVVNIVNGSFVITAIDPTTNFKADYDISDNRRATFESVTFRVLYGDAKRMTFAVYDGNREVETGDMRVGTSLQDQTWTSPFLLGPVGDSIVFLVSPEGNPTAIALEILDVGFCLEDETATTPASPEVCGSDWAKYSGYCYKQFAADGYDNAVASCQAAGATLASVQSEGELNFISQMVGDKFWLGGNDKNAEGTWVWEDGTAFFQNGAAVNNTYNNWASGEPDGDHNGKDADCLLVLLNDAWKDAPCTWKKKFVCEVADESASTTATTTTTPAPVTYPSGCVAGWSEFQGSCYKYFSSNLEFTEAKDACANFNLSPSGVIVSPAKTAEEFNFIYYTLAPAESLLWLGGSETVEEGTFVWLDGSPLTYNNWKTGEPDNVQGPNTDVDCMDVLKHNGKWRDVPCSWKRPYVCKYTPGA